MRREAPPAHLPPASVASTRIGACRGSLEDRPGALDDGLEGRGREEGQARQIAGDRSRRSSVVRGARARRRRSRTVVVARAGASGSPRCERRGEREGTSSDGEPCRCRERRGLGSVARAREPASPAIGGCRRNARRENYPRAARKTRARQEVRTRARTCASRGSTRASRAPLRVFEDEAKPISPTTLGGCARRRRNAPRRGAARSKEPRAQNPLLRNTRVCRWAGSSPVFDSPTSRARITNAGRPPRVTVTPSPAMSSDSDAERLARLVRVVRSDAPERFRLGCRAAFLAALAEVAPGAIHGKKRHVDRRRSHDAVASAPATRRLSANDELHCVASAGEVGASVRFAKGTLAYLRAELDPPVRALVYASVPPHLPPRADDRSRTTPIPPRRTPRPPPRTRHPRRRPPRRPRALTRLVLDGAGRSPPRRAAALSASPASPRSIPTPPSPTPPPRPTRGGRDSLGGRCAAWQRASGTKPSSASPSCTSGTGARITFGLPSPEPPGLCKRYPVLSGHSV